MIILDQMEMCFGVGVLYICLFFLKAGVGRPGDEAQFGCQTNDEGVQHTDGFEGHRD